MVWLDQNGRLLSMVENLFLSCESIAFQSQVSKALICPANFNVASCFEMCHPSRRDNLLTLVVLCPHLEREIKFFDYTLCKVPPLTKVPPSRRWLMIGAFPKHSTDELLISWIDIFYSPFTSTKLKFNFLFVVQQVHITLKFKQN